MIREIDGILLDVDGTLWNSTGIVAKAWTRAVRENGYEDMTVTAEQLRGLFGKTMAVIAENLLPQAGEPVRKKIMEVCCKYEHQALAEDECRICYPGVPETIRALSERLPVFIVSNCQSGYIELFLEKTGLGPYITDFECYGNTGKNKDENIRLVAERNGLKHPVYVGDTQGDCDASREANVPFVLAAYGFGNAKEPDAEISSFPELLDLTADVRSGDRDLSGNGAGSQKSRS